MADLLALASSLLWGGSDFLGGVVSRRLPVSAVVALSQTAALGGLLVVLAVLRSHAPGTYLGYGAAAGVVGAVALGCFYTALAGGRMGVVAPLAATGVVVPLAVGLASGDRVTPAQLAGMALVVVSLLAVGRQPDLPAAAPRAPGAGTTPPMSNRRMVGLSLAAAAGFGTVFVLLRAGSRVDVLTTLVAQRTVVAVPLTILLVARRKLRRPARGDAWQLAVIGAADLSANACFGLASRHGAGSVIGVLSSLYPAITLLLARVLLSERLARVQAAGVAGVLTGVVLLAAG